MVMPGDNVEITGTLHTPIAMEKELQIRDSRGWTNRRRGRH